MHMDETLCRCYGLLFPIFCWELALKNLNHIEQFLVYPLSVNLISYGSPWLYI